MDKRDKMPKNIAAKTTAIVDHFDVLMPRSERDGECILPNVEFGTMEVKIMVIYFLIITDVGTHYCNSLRWA